MDVTGPYAELVYMDLRVENETTPDAIKHSARKEEERKTEQLVHGVAAGKTELGKCLNKLRAQQLEIAVTYSERGDCVHRHNSQGHHLRQRTIAPVAGYEVCGSDTAASRHN
jgi:hypothetical protein